MLRSGSRRESCHRADGSRHTARASWRHFRKAAHLAGIEQAVRIDLMLESQLIRVDALVAAAILDRKDVRVGDIDLALLVKPDDLVQSVRIFVAHHRQSAASDAAVEADEFEM